MSALRPPDGRAHAPWVDAAQLARVLRVMGAALPVALVEPAAAEIPLVVLRQADLFAGGVALRPQFGRPSPSLRGAAVTLRLVSDVAVNVAAEGAAPVRREPGEAFALDLAAVGPELRLSVDDGERVARVRVPVEPEAALAPEQEWPLPGGVAWTLCAPGHASLRCPLVVVEGFPGGHGFQFSCDLLAQHGVLDALRAAGYDLVVVGLADGTRCLAENAEVVRAALVEAGRQTSLPVTVLGWSMGGLLARQAITELEAAGDGPPVETLVTWDTPHRGAMTQLGVQWFVSAFADALPALGAERALIDSPANRELDMVSLLNGHAAPDPRHTAAMAGIGWPRTARRVLVSSGRGDGRVELEPGRVLVHWQAADGGEVTVRALGTTGGDPLAAGRIDGCTPTPLAVDGLPAWDGMPGGRADYPARAAQLLSDLRGGRMSLTHVPATCAIPTVSALDLDAAPDTRLAPSDPARIACRRDHPHLEIDAPAAARLLAVLGRPFDPDAFDPHAPGFLADPFPTFERFRRFAPVHGVGDGVWCFTAASCRAVLDDDAMFRKHPPETPPAAGPQALTAGLAPSLFAADPPDHRALRSAVEGPLRAALPGVPGLATAHARTLLSVLSGTSCLELVSDYALPLPAAVLFDLLGLPDDAALRGTLISWQRMVATAHDATQSVATRVQGFTCALALRGAFGALLERHRQGDPQPGLTGALIDSFAIAGLSDGQLIGSLCDVLIAGYLSTTFLIATGLHRLLSAFPESLESLRADPSRAAAVVEELLRLDGPVTLIDRFAVADTELEGVRIPAGSHVLAVVGAAGRDPAAYEDPDRMRLDRAADSLAFGAGIHTCVGAPVARAVTPIALCELLSAYGEIELDGEAQWQADPYLHAVTSLPLRVRA